MSSFTSPAEKAAAYTQVKKRVEDMKENATPFEDISPTISSWNSSLLIFQLSGEMLGRILTTRLPDDKTPEGLRVLRLGLVCKDWRRFVLARPHLWRHPFFGVNECAKAMIERAQPHPLLIDLSLDSSYMPDQSASVHTAFTHLHRAETLSVSMKIGQQRDYEAKRVESLLSFLQAPAPILESFALIASRSTPDTLIPHHVFQTQSSNLQQVRLINWNLSWDLRLPPGFLKLTDLAIILDASTRTGYSVARFTIPQVLPALSVLPNLRSLELGDILALPTEREKTWSKEGIAARWNNLKKFQLADRFEAANVVFNCIAYPVSANISVIGIPRSETNNGFQDSLGLFRKLAARAGGRIHVLKIAQGPSGDYTFSGWTNASQIPLADVLNNIPPRIKLEGPLNGADIIPCLKRTPIDHVEHAVIARAPIGEVNWKKFGCLECLKSVRVVGDDLDLVKVLHKVPPHDPDHSEGTLLANQAKVPFAKLDSLHLEDWRFSLTGPFLTNSPTVIQAPTPLQTNFDDLNTIIRSRVDRGYGPKRLSINPIEHRFEARIRELMDFCEMSSCFDWEKLEVRE